MRLELSAVYGPKIEFKRFYRKCQYLVLVRENTDIFIACWEAALHCIYLFQFFEKVNRLRLLIPDDK